MEEKNFPPPPPPNQHPHPTVVPDFMYNMFI